MYIEGRVQNIHTREGWEEIKTKFLYYYNPIESTPEQQIKAWRDMKWQPLTEELGDFVVRFCQLGHVLGSDDEQQMQYFRLIIPPALYLYLDCARTVPETVENLKKGISLGGLGSLTPQTHTTDDQKPTVPFMTMKDKRRSKSQEKILHFWTH